MSEERLRRAAGALERSVAGVDVMERLEALGRRRQRQRTTTVLAVLVAAAVFGGAALGLRALRATDPVAGPLPADPAAPPGWWRRSRSTATRPRWRSVTTAYG
jgi:hypothetical protein